MYRELTIFLLNMLGTICLLLAGFFLLVLSVDRSNDRLFSFLQNIIPLVVIGACCHIIAAAIGK